MANKDQIIDGRFRIVEQIGEGGMSRVYLAIDVNLNKTWAVKEVKKSGNEKKDAQVKEALTSEADLLKSLDNPAFPRVVSIVSENGLTYFVLDYVEGQTISEVLREKKTLPEAEVLSIAKQLCVALDYLHTHEPPIIFRDLKPSNVMLKPDGTAIIIDFGIAKAQVKSVFGEDDSVKNASYGTLGYSSPEQVRGDAHLDGRSDIYSLGIMLYQMLTGTPAVELQENIAPLRQVNPSVSGGMEAIVAKAVSKNIDDRYDSALSMLYDLEHYQQIDRAHFCAERKKYRTFKAVVGSAVVCALASVITFGVANKLLSDDYDHQISLGDKATTQSEATEHYTKASKIKPEVLTAYKRMIEKYKDDGTFSTSEESQLLSCLVSNLSAIGEGSENYCDICFEVGRLYWYYYKADGIESRSTNLTTKIIHSKSWFDDALSNDNFKDKSIVEIYDSIANFTSTITPAINEGSDIEKYPSFFGNLENLIEMANSNNNEVVRVTTAEIIYDSVDTYARKFKASGVEKTEVQTLVMQAGELSSSTDATTDEISERIDDLNKRKTQLNNAINVAFSDVKAATQTLTYSSGVSA